MKSKLIRQLAQFGEKKEGITKEITSTSWQKTYKEANAGFRIAKSLETLMTVEIRTYVA